MTENTGSAAPSTTAPKTEKVAKKNAAENAKRDELFAQAKARAAQKFKEERAQQKEKPEKPEAEKLSPEVLPTTNERELTYGDVEGWVSKGVLKDPNYNDRVLPYTIKTGEDGASAQIWQGEKMVGFIRAGIGPHTTSGGELIAGVETINVNNENQKRGLGVVLAIAFYVRSKNGNAGYVELATKDTSGAFWPNLGMHEKVPISIETAKGNVRAFRIRW